MKIKMFIGIMAILIAGILLGNWHIGNRTALKIDRKLRTEFSKAEMPVILTFSEVQVNPLLSKVNISSVSMTDNKSAFKLTCDAIETKMAYSEAAKLSGSDEFEEINSFVTTFEQLKFIRSANNSEMTMDKVIFKFDGHLTKGMIQEIEDFFPQEEQHVEVSFSNVTFDFPEMYRELSITPDIQEKISSIDKAVFSFSFLPDSKELRLTKLSLTTPVSSLDYSGYLAYSGNTPRKFAPRTLGVNTDLLITPSQLTFGQPDATGRFGFSKFSISSLAELKFNERGDIGKQLPEGEFSFLLEDFTAEFAGRPKKLLERNDIGKIIGIDFEKIDIEKAALSYSMKNNRVIIANTKLITPFFKATLDADIQVDPDRKDNSVINNARFVLSDIAPDFELGIAKIEREIKQSLPREGKNIVLKASGKLGAPEIVGLEMFMKRNKTRALEGSVKSNMHTVQLAAEDFAVRNVGNYANDINPAYELFEKWGSNPPVNPFDPGLPGVVSGIPTRQGQVGYEHQGFNSSTYKIRGYGTDGLIRDASGQVFTLSNSW